GIAPCRRARGGRLDPPGETGPRSLADGRSRRTAPGRALDQRAGIVLVPQRGRAGGAARAKKAAAVTSPAPAAATVRRVLPAPPAGRCGEWLVGEGKRAAVGA